MPPEQTIQQRVTVSYEYPVHFCRAVFSPQSDLLERFFGAMNGEGERRKVFVVVDDGVVAARPSILQEIADKAAQQAQWFLAAPPEGRPGGEAAKNDPGVLAGLYQRICDLGLDRHACIMVVGGGALIDAVGYAAATAHRGIRLVRLPTTVLSQNDAGVGVKNGVNAFGSKNFLGTFAPPTAVINDLEFLRTLSERDRRAGLAESVKVALIKEPAFFDWLEENAPALAVGEEEALRHSVVETARLHLEHISGGGDPFEMGRARPLDFGHWSAHKLESLSKHELRHGEAVAIGIALDVRYSVEAGMLGAQVGERVLALLHGLGLPLYHQTLELLDSDGSATFLAGLEEFRQHLGGQLCVTQLTGVGESLQVDHVNTSQVLAARDWLREWAL